MKGTLRLICLAGILAIPITSLPPEAEVESVTVDIRSRLFIPQRVLLHHNQRAVLRFRNHDTELHTVVAPEIFRSVNLSIEGNGAQDFGPEGLKRVIIPPEGLIEFQFTPARTGIFSYLCDMPGHNMQALVVVE